MVRSITMLSVMSTGVSSATPAEGTTKHCRLLWEGEVVQGRQRKGGSRMNCEKTRASHRGDQWSPWEKKKKIRGDQAWVFLRRNTNTTFGIVHFFFYRDSLREEKKEQTGN